MYLASSEHVKSSKLGGILKSTFQTMKSMQLQGDPKQQGGQFVLGPGNHAYSITQLRNVQLPTCVQKVWLSMALASICCIKFPPFTSRDINHCVAIHGDPVVI